jgi:hypothetical protein
MFATSALQNHADCKKGSDWSELDVLALKPINGNILLMLIQHLLQGLQVSVDDTFKRGVHHGRCRLFKSGSCEHKVSRMECIKILLYKSCVDAIERDDAAAGNPV